MQPSSTPAVRGNSHSHYRFVQTEVTCRPAKSGVAETEDPAIGSDQPVPATIGTCLHPHHGLVEVDIPGRAEERCIEREDPTVGSDQPVAPGRRISFHPDDR